MSTHAAARLAWFLCTLTVVLVTFVVVFAVFYQDNLRNMPYLLGVVTNALVGAVLASHRPRNPVGWFFVFSAVSFAVSEAMFRYAVYGLVIDPGSLPLARAMAWPPTWLWVPGALVLVFLPLYFPNGRLLSPRWRPVLWLTIFLSVVTAILSAFSPAKVNDAWDITNPLGLAALRPANGAVEVVMAVLLLSSVVSLVVRFRRSQGREHQQMKWITYATGTMFTMVMLVTVLDLVAANSALARVANPLTGAMFAGIPVAVGIAVLRYRLYEIDRIINRTLVYVALSVTLALLYFGGVTLTQIAFGALTGRGDLPQFAIVASTLAIAVLFNPLRHRIQYFIDKRFYRKKYDARKTLESFSAKLRDETDLDALSEDLVGVARETMQPTHASLWLRPDTATRDRQPQ